MHLSTRESQVPDDGRAPSDYDLPESETDEPIELDALDDADDDDSRWDAFLADDDERDPLPEPGDFWIEDEGE